MPSVAVKLYSVFFKFLLKHRLQNRSQTQLDEDNPFGVSSRPEESVAAANPTFTDGVATKDIHIDPFTSLTVRIFLPQSALVGSDSDTRIKSRVNRTNNLSPPETDPIRRNSYGTLETPKFVNLRDENRRSSAGGEAEIHFKQENGVYRGYSPLIDNYNQINRKLPVMLQFHGGGFVSGSNDSVANDMFCRRIAKLCDVIVIAVGYRLAPENRYPAAFEDGVKVLHWLGKQANLAECSKSIGNPRGGDADLRKSDHRHIANTLGSSIVEPWLAAHADPSSNYFDVENLKGWLANAYAYTALTDYPTPTSFIMPLPAYPVKQMCKAIDDPTSGNNTFAKLYSAANIYYNYTGSATCFDLADNSEPGGWNWQVCTEMIMPDASGEESLFPPYEWNYTERASGCKSAYGVEPRPQWITSEFGGHNIKMVLKHFGSNIIFFNGLRDPWSGGGVLNSISDSIIAIVAKEGAHHVDLRFSDKDDPQWLKDVRLKEIEIISKWLREYYQG